MFNILSSTKKLNIQESRKPDTNSKFTNRERAADALVSFAFRTTWFVTGQVQDLAVQACGESVLPRAFEFTRQEAPLDSC